MYALHASLSTSSSVHLLRQPFKLGSTMVWTSCATRYNSSKTSQLIHTYILHSSPAQGWGQVRSLGQLAARTGVQNKRSLLTAGTKDPDTPTAEGARARPSGTNYQLHVAASQQNCEVLRFELENSFNLVVCIRVCVSSM